MRNQAQGSDGPNIDYCTQTVHLFRDIWFSFEAFYYYVMVRFNLTQSGVHVAGVWRVVESYSGNGFLSGLCRPLHWDCLCQGQRAFPSSMHVYLVVALPARLNSGCDVVGASNLCALQFPQGICNLAMSGDLLGLCSWDFLNKFSVNFIRCRKANTCNVHIHGRHPCSYTECCSSNLLNQ